MTVLIQLRDAFKRYGDQQLLDGAGFTLSDDDKIGLIGRNGAGKSTLCRVLLDEESLDSGELFKHSRLRLGYLRQHDPFRPQETVLEFLMRDSGQPDWRCGEVAWQFEFKAPLLSRRIGEFSGGWQTRIKLAALLLHDPNLLLLDEPTNFLDLRTQILLEEFLKEFRGASLVVSHDRKFLRDTCTSTLELARGKLTMYPGNVDAYVENQRERRLHDERVNAAVLAKRKQLETFIDKNRARASTASQARSKAKQLERLELRTIDGPETTVRIRAPQVEPRKGPAARCVDLAIGYPDHQVARGINLEVPHGSRVAVVGDNGQGKTTFLRTLVGSLDPIAGEVRWGHGCDTGTYAQHVYTSLPESWTVQEYLQDRAAATVRTQTILDVAGSFLFRGELVEKRIAVLSGGERARLCLAGLLLGRHNVLVLDEPGNHLDVDTVEALADALVDYQGTIVFTSHDRYFMQRVASGVIEVRDGSVANYPGDYSNYVWRIEQEVKEGTRTDQPQTTGAPVRAAGTSRPDARSSAQREREMKKEIAALERKIERLDQRKKAVQAELLTVTESAAARKLQRELADVTTQLAELEHKWLELHEAIQGPR
jgi:ATP-binding cassette subfamily F protein 3